MLTKQVKTNAESQLQIAIGVLLENAADKNVNVAAAVTNAIMKLSDRHPNQVMSACCNFCSQSTKPTQEHLYAIICIMERICGKYIVALDGDTVLSTIQFAMETMTTVDNEKIEAHASGILVEIGRKHSVQVMDYLIKKLEPGLVSHYMVARTLGSLANVNAHGVVPYLKVVYGLILPVLAFSKTDSLRMAFAYALGCFSEALMEYASAHVGVPDNTITVEQFYTEAGIAFDILFGTWLTSKDNKVVESVLVALSALVPALNSDKISQHCLKAITTLLALYKRPIDSYVVTKCLSAILCRATPICGAIVEPLLPNLLQNMSEFICVSDDYAKPELLRNHSEILRSYEYLAKYFSNNTIDYAFTLIRHNSDKERIKGLIIISHLVSYAPEEGIQHRTKDIIKHLHDLLNDSNVRTRKAVMKIIVVFLCKGQLLDAELNPEGVDKYLEFLLKLCTRSTVNALKTDISNQELMDIEKSADNTLLMLCTSVTELKESLWSMLLTHLLNGRYEEIVTILLKCLTHLSYGRTAINQFEAILIRCLTLLANPLPNFRGNIIIKFLKNLQVINCQHSLKLWKAKLKQLESYLEQNYEMFNMNEWNELVFNFLAVILEQNIVITSPLAEAGRAQMKIYTTQRLCPEKNMLLKCVSIVLCRVSDGTIIIETINDMLGHLPKTGDFSELDTCAEAIGICSQTHLHLILDKLSNVRAELLNKRASASKFQIFHSFMKDQRNEVQQERIRYTIIACYAAVCNESGGNENLLRIIESEVMDYVIDELTNCKDTCPHVRRVCLRAIAQVAEAMHPSRNKLHIRLRDRDKILILVLKQLHLHSGADYIELFPIIVPVLSSLVRLPLPVEGDMRQSILKQCFEKVYNASAIYCRINANTSPLENTNLYYGETKLVPFVTSTFSKLNQLVYEILMQSLTTANLYEISTMLEPWLARKKAEQRLPAIETLRMVLHSYLENMSLAHDSPKTGQNGGHLVARIIPRCSDPNKNIRIVAVDCICQVLSITCRQEGYPQDDYSSLSNTLRDIQQQIELDDPKVLFNMTNKIALVVCSHLLPVQIWHLVDGLIDALLDYESSSSTGASIVLSVTLKEKGTELQQYAPMIIDRIIIQLNRISCPRTKSYTLRSILNFTAHQPRVMVTMLLNQPVPFSSQINDCWQTMMVDIELASDIIDQLKRTIKHSVAYEEHGSGDSVMKVATLNPLQAMFALKAMLSVHTNSDLRQMLQDQFSDLFSLLLVGVACYLGVSAPANFPLPSTSSSSNTSGSKSPTQGTFWLNRDAVTKVIPAQVAIEAFRLFLQHCGYGKTAAYLADFNATDERVLDGQLIRFVACVSNLANGVCTDLSSDNNDSIECSSISGIITDLGPTIRADLETQRIAAVAFFANLLKYISSTADENVILAENLLEMILDVQMDSNWIVRKAALEGLGFAVQTLPKSLVERHCQPILSAFMNSLDYNVAGNGAAVVLEGMVSFSKILSVLEGRRLSACQVTAAVRIKPLFDYQEDVQMRRASIRLLGDLARSLHEGDTNVDAFKEQVQGNFLTMLIHLNDSDHEVIRHSKYALRYITPFLDCPQVNTMIQEHLIEDAQLQYTEFTRDLVKIMAVELQDLFILLINTGLTYLRSGCLEIRSSATLLVGLLYSHVNGVNRKRVSLDTVCDRLMRLLKDDEEAVRMEAIQALAYLFVD